MGEGLWTGGTVPAVQAAEKHLHERRLPMYNEKEKNRHRQYFSHPGFRTDRFPEERRIAAAPRHEPGFGGGATTEDIDIKEEAGK